VSSVYHVLCMSHDPAIQVARWENDGRDEAIAAALDPASHEDLVRHEHCDLLVGRYSYPLVELCCPARRGMGLAHGRHSGEQWIDKDYLLLLSAAMDVEGNEALDAAVERVTRFGCWTEQRIRRLRIELGIEVPAAWKDPV
jgi:hypothetical protein